MNHYYYILDADGNPKPEDDLYAWAKWFETADRTLARDTIGPVDVSTVFLGLSHQWGDGSPTLFETLAFVPNNEGELIAVENSMRRYETREQAMTGHAEVLAFLRSLPNRNYLPETEQS